MTVSRFLLRLRRKVRQRLPEPVTQLFQKGTSYMQLITQTFPGGATLTGWVHARVESCPSFDKRPAVLILPGGGYDYCSQREGEPVALQFLAAGYQAFVLEYSTAQKAANWQPMIDAARAMVWLRSNAGQLNLMPNKIAVCGFSAGGHLAASTAILWDATPVQEALGKERGKNCPNAVILGYPVVTSGEFAHEGSIDNIAGDDKALWQTFSLENQVRPGLPPFYIWHTVADTSVPVENSLLLASALRRNRVPFEMHLFAEGHHGMSLCTAEVHEANPHNAHWFGLCREWLDHVFAYQAGADGDPNIPCLPHGGKKG